MTFNPNAYERDDTSNDSDSKDSHKNDEVNVIQVKTKSSLPRRLNTVRPIITKKWL